MVVTALAFACGGAALATLLRLPNDSFILFAILTIAIATARESFAFSVFSMPSFGGFGTLLVSPETFGNVKMLGILYVVFVLIGGTLAYLVPYARRKSYQKKAPKRRVVPKKIFRQTEDLWRVS